MLGGGACRVRVGDHGGHGRPWVVAATGAPPSRSILCVLEHFHGKMFIF